MSILEEIATRIRAARKTAGVTQQELANRLVIDQGHISRIERGQKGTSIEILVGIAKELGVSIAHLYGENSNTETEATAGIRPEGLTDEAIELARAWQELPSEQRAAMKVAVESLRNSLE